MATIKLDYVIAAWGGRRGYSTRPNKRPYRALTRYETDPAWYLRRHLQAILELAGMVDRVTIVVPPPAKQQGRFLSFVRELPETVGDLQVRVVWTKSNRDMSFGSWTTAIRETDDVDHFFLQEDDYASRVVDFDAVMLDALEPGAAVAASSTHRLRRSYGGEEFDYAMPTGLLLSAEDLHGFTLVYGRKRDLQLRFFKSLWLSGINRIVYMTDRGWSFEYRSADGETVRFGKGPVLVGPIED